MPRVPGHVSSVRLESPAGLPRHNGTGHWSPALLSRRQSGSVETDSERALYTISLIVSPYGDKHNPMTLILIPRGCSLFNTVHSEKERQEKMYRNVLFVPKYTVLILIHSITLALFLTQSVQSEPSAAVILIRERQSASALCELEGSRPSRYLWRVGCRKLSGGPILFFFTSE